MTIKTMMEVGQKSDTQFQLSQWNHLIAINISTAPQDFVLPELNTKAKHYFQLITYERKWGRWYFKASSSHGQQIKNSLACRLVTEPPLTRNLSEAELHGFLLRPMRTEFLCHAQPCERGVKLTSDICSTKAGYLKHLGIALIAEMGWKEERTIRPQRL